MPVRDIARRMEQIKSAIRQYDTSGRMLYEYIVPVNSGDKVRAYILINEDGNWNSGSVSMYFVK